MKLATGASHSVGLKRDATVVAWGDNRFGQATVPFGLSGVISIAAGAYHSLVLKRDGTVVAWGMNDHGEATVPAGLSGVVAIAAGADYNLALKIDGSMVAWGDSRWGQLNVPRGAPGGKAVAAGGSHGLMLNVDGTVTAWGANGSGQATVPSGLSGVIAIAAGDSHSLALKTDGTVVAWGWNVYGQAMVPTGLSGVIAVAAGHYHSLALKSDGTVVGWGGDNQGEATVPGGLSGVIAIAAGGVHSLALKSDGTVVAWGSNANGEGRAPGGLSSVIAIAASVEHSVALRRDGTVVTRGSNDYGQMEVPRELSGAISIAAGDYHSLALRADGVVIAWGSNRFGEASVPRGLSDVIAIAAGSSHSLALRNDRTVVAWGRNDFRQATVPRGLSDVIAITAGGLQSLALTGTSRGDTIKQPSSGLLVRVVETDAHGRSWAPLAGALVEFPDRGKATTDARGETRFSGLSSDTIFVTASKAGYYSVGRTVTLRDGESKQEEFRLTPQPAAGTPASTPLAFDFASPNGKHFIEGMPGNLTFTTAVAWNGSPGSVRFNVAGTWYPAQVTSLSVAGQAQATLTIPAPAKVSACSELTVEVTNGDGKATRINSGVYFHALPELIPLWFGDKIPWPPFGLSYSEESRSPGGLLSTMPVGPLALEGYSSVKKTLIFDPWAGLLNGDLAWSLGVKGKTDSLRLPGISVRFLGEVQGNLGGGLEVTLTGCERAGVNPHWTLGVAGKVGFGVPTVTFAGLVVPATAPVINALLDIPVVGDAVRDLETRFFVVFGVDWTGKYPNLELGDNPLLLWAKTVDGSATLGLEIQSVIDVQGVLYVGLYGGGTATFPQKLPIEISKVRGCFGAFAEYLLFRYKTEIGVDFEFNDGKPQSARPVGLANSNGSNGWQPIGSSYSRWGRANRLATREVALHGNRSAGLGNPASEVRIIENVTRLASPSAFCDAASTTLLFSLLDTNKPWHAATDIGTVRRPVGGTWVLGRIADDQAAEFSPCVVTVNSNLVLATWTRVEGDVSGATNPVQVAPKLEIVASWFERATNVWTPPAQLSTNSVVDRNPMPVVIGMTQGVVWIQNQSDASLGDAAHGDRLLFARWTGTSWETPQTLWSGSKGIPGVSFTADSSGQGHVVFGVDEDGKLDTRTDRELYAVSTANSVWQAARRLTNDQVEDALPTLVAPNGTPICVWSASGTLTFTTLTSWNPKAVYAERTLANEAPTLDGVTLPGGAAVAYAVQGTNGVDIVASFYDAQLDRWSLPRQLTHDEHVESALSLAFDGTNIVLAYLKTQTLRTNTVVEINGQKHELQNIPQPGRTDLYVLRHALGNDVAVQTGSLVFDPPNPTPGSTVTNKVVIENRGDLPVQNVQVSFYDGDPQRGGIQIGSAQTIAGPLVGGAKQEVSVIWTVPSDLRSHEVHVVVDPALAFDDRDRANNAVSKAMMLPDIAIETCWSSEISPSAVALVARLTNSGVTPTGPFEVSWRLGSAGGEEIGRSRIDSLAAGDVNEISYQWETAGRRFAGDFVTVFAVADAANAVRELDKANNAYPQTVRVVPGWLPRVGSVKVLDTGSARLAFEASGGVASAFAVESTGSLASPIQWSREPNATITTTEPGKFEVQLPIQGGMRFYRIGVAP